MAAPPTVQPSAEHAELALRAAELMLAPMAIWLLRHGVSYPSFAERLKSVFLDAARNELENAGTAPSQSALSLLSGVHRKDVRVLALASSQVHTTPRPPLSSQVFTRWLTDPRWRTSKGVPRVLPRSGGERSFEALCRELSNDMHPRTILDELLRLGHVELQGDNVAVSATSFVPTPHLDELTSLFASGVHDHIAAAVHNITESGPKFLEQSIYADGLTPESIAVLHDAARAAWAQAFEAVVPKARERVDLDGSSDGAWRMRLGVYAYSEQVSQPAPPARLIKSPTAKKRGPSRGKS